MWALPRRRFRMMFALLIRLKLLLYPEIAIIVVDIGKEYPLEIGIDISDGITTNITSLEK